MPGTERGSFLAEDPPATPGPAQGPNAKTEQVAAAGVEQDACPPFFPPDELLHRPEWQPDIQEAVTRPREDDDLGTDAGLVGRFQHGALLGHRPRTLATWLVTATSPSVVDRIAQVLGGHPQRDPITGHAEVVTASTTVDILLPGLHAIRVGWQGIDRRACDGTSREDGRSCICPSAIAHRRSEARLGHGCQPRAEIIFRLVEDPALGHSPCSATTGHSSRQQSTCRQRCEGSTSRPPPRDLAFSGPCTSCGAAGPSPTPTR